MVKMDIGPTADGDIDLYEYLRVVDAALTEIVGVGVKIACDYYVITYGSIPAVDNIDYWAFMFHRFLSFLLPIQTHNMEMSCLRLFQTTPRHRYIR